MTDPLSESKTYVVEHLDPELEDWSTLEYKTIAHECNDAGVKFVLCNAPQLPEALSHVTTFQAHQKSFDELFGANKDRICLLDPGSKREPTKLDLSPEDGQKFDVFLFGGIKGDHLYQSEEPNDSDYDEHAQISLDRTSLLRQRGYERRRLGNVQLTTDTAVRVTRMVIENHMRLEEIPYVEFPECKINQYESIEMPFRYVADQKGKPIMPNGMLDLIARDSDQSIEDLL